MFLVGIEETMNFSQLRESLEDNSSLFYLLHIHQVLCATLKEDHRNQSLDFVPYTVVVLVPNT